MKAFETALDTTIGNLTRRLLEKRTAQGHWEGKLSTSALSTATAVSALALACPKSDAIGRGIGWLKRNQNPDGGWGDTVLSKSNISTTALCWASFAIAGSGSNDTVQAAERWLSTAVGGLNPASLAAAVILRYGNDRTFSAPILTVLALAGKLGSSEKDAWRFVPQLPFELAVTPRSWFRWLRVPVVSYALPALIAIGHVRHHHRPARNPIARMARVLARRRTLRVLREIQPSSGGFLEAIPLTSFVVMSLAASGEAKHPVVEDGVSFLLRSISTEGTDEGAWPIDTNLATWTTTLAVNALSGLLASGERAPIVQWLLAQQYREIHPYTQSAPGGWAWTDLPGGVPDADDTAGALLALKNLDADGKCVQQAAEGVRWLLDLQNRDGGIPTFCRGLGHLPFDRSSPDLTAHALLAWGCWLDKLATPLRGEVLQGMQRAVSFLGSAQRDDGAWSPLWFGNEHASEEENLTYGTARVLRALDAKLAAGSPQVIPMAEKGVAWLLNAQNPEGGWGGAKQVRPSLEETGAAIEALAVQASRAGRQEVESAMHQGMCRGIEWLAASSDLGQRTPASPIGLYFAKLWYFEELYPLIFSLGGLDRARSFLEGRV